MESKQMGFFEEKKYIRLGKDGKVYYITAREAEQEEVITAKQLAQYSHIREANRLGKIAAKLHHRAYGTDDSVLVKAYRRALIKYKGKVALLEKTSPGLVHPLIQTILAKLKPLERKISVIPSTALSESLYTQFVKALMEYEALYDQAEVLMEVALSVHGYLLMVTANGDRVAFARDDTKDRVPDGHAIFTKTELRILEGNIPRLVLEAKKLVGVEVASVEKNRSKFSEAQAAD